MIMEDTLVSAIQISVYLFGESVVSTYSIHNNKVRNMKDTSANDDMFISVIGPEVGEADKVLAKLLITNLLARMVGILPRQNLFRTSVKTMEFF